MKKEGIDTPYSATEIREKKTATHFEGDLL